MLFPSYCTFLLFPLYNVSCFSPVLSCSIRSGIGAWLNCLQFLSFASVFTNCYLLAMVSSNIKAIVPQMIHEYIDSEYGR